MDVKGVPRVLAKPKRARPGVGSDDQEMPAGPEYPPELGGRSRVIREDVPDRHGEGSVKKTIREREVIAAPLDELPVRMRVNLARPGDQEGRRLEARVATGSLIAEVLEGHIHSHVLKPGSRPGKQQLEAADELVSIIKTYLS
jgi:hypothetical protein